MLPLQTRVDMGAMATKGYSTFPKASPSDCFVSYLGLSLGELYLSVELQSVYSAVPADWAKKGIQRKKMDKKFYLSYASETK